MIRDVTLSSHFRCITYINTHKHVHRRTRDTEKNVWNGEKSTRPRHAGRPPTSRRAARRACRPGKSSRGACGHAGLTSPTFSAQRNHMRSAAQGSTSWPCSASARGVPRWVGNQAPGRMPRILGLRPFARPAAATCELPEGFAAGSRNRLLAHMLTRILHLLYQIQLLATGPHRVCSALPKRWEPSPPRSPMGTVSPDHPRPERKSSLASW